MAIDWTNLFKKYKGEWVTLKDDEVTVISSGFKAKVALDKAKKSGYDNPILFRVPNKVMPLIECLG